MIVDQNAVGFSPSRRERRHGFGQIDALEHTAAPAAQQRVHAVENRTLVVDAKHNHAVEAPALALARSGGPGRRPDRGRTPRRDRKTRALASIRFQRYLAIEHAGNALNNRQAETDAARHPRALVEAMEFFEYSAMFGRRNTDPGVININAQ